jgi:hypothetical protein
MRGVSVSGVGWSTGIAPKLETSPQMGGHGELMMELSIHAAGQLLISLVTAGFALFFSVTAKAICPGI